ncbi:uncharacterized protein CMU_038780 [Cryptosporidium muris RN66]|uniref:Uncharacterized protein n=1 Tax=Cryptosporidium muris (strain RN66) TaxID=441375 RepID=B6A9C0_CRYMR|nr:uncharacterized protein CMU_038780 [Cryptosporidium muris RN66]EEA04811.1 hypothetical protein, conserved [Cryptosporidium muris RN66]|eukprot:XP_002139160.1 hypothetical protein [Cryptosporidium muris RN66]
MKRKNLYDEIKYITKSIEELQDSLSNPLKREEYREYVNKDENFLNNMNENDHESFAMCCEFGSVKALINEKRYNNIFKKTQNSTLEDIIRKWKWKYMIVPPSSNSQNNDDNTKILDHSNSIFDIFNWNRWYDDNYGINKFPLNTLDFHTLQGIISMDMPSKVIKKRKEIAHKDNIHATKLTENFTDTNNFNIKEIEATKYNIYEWLKLCDRNQKGLKFWDIVLDIDKEKGFSNTCLYIFCLLSLLKDGLIMIHSPNRIIELNSDDLVIWTNKDSLSDRQKSTGIISNFSYLKWCSLCENKSRLDACNFASSTSFS